MIYSTNEWDDLKKVIIGHTHYANWPTFCSDFRKQEITTKWNKTKLPKGPVDDIIITESNEDLNKFSDILTSLNIEVIRPSIQNFQKTDGFYNMCPRDRILIIGDKIIDCPMTYGCRKQEIHSYNFQEEIITCNIPEAKFDAANILRLNNDILYLLSDTGNYDGYKWLQRILGDKYKIHVIDNYNGVHIDSTFSAIREGLIVVNSSRVNKTNIPEILKTWDVIYLNDCIPQNFTQYPYASKWIGMNFLTINPNLIICDPKQVELIDKISKYNIDYIGLELRHSRTLGGGHHCCSLDLLRD